MKKELNARQWALYNYVKSMNDTWTTQWNVAKALYMLDGFYAIEDRAKFHDSATRMQMTADIRAINDSSVIQKVIISSPRGIKIANSEEFDRYIKKEISAALRRLLRAKHKQAKGAKDGQMRLVLGSERDTVKAYIDSDKIFGQRLRAARLLKGLKAKEVVDCLKDNGLHVDEPLLSKFEHGYCVPNKTTLAKLAEIYATTAETLLYGQFTDNEGNGENNGLQVGEAVRNG